MKYRLSVIGLILLAASTVKLYSQSGSEMSVSAGAAIGVGTYFNTTYSASIVEGYRFNKFFFTGIGVGFGYSNVLNEVDINEFRTAKYRSDAYLVPVFLNAKANLPCSRFSPFVSLNIGYTFDLNKNFGDAPGFMIEPAVGIDYILDSEKAVYFLAGLNFQRGEYGIVTDNTNTTGDSDFIYKSEMFKAISLRLGFKF